MFPFNVLSFCSLAFRAIKKYTSKKQGTKTHLIYCYNKSRLFIFIFYLFIQVERKIVFSNESAPEVGTSCASMNRTGKTNAKKGPKEDYNAFKEFQDREIEGHVLASFMNYSGMSSMEGKSCKQNKICSTKKYVHKYVTWVF